MSTTPTNLPVPSESPRDLKFNAGKFDEVMTSSAHYYTDRFGKQHWTISGFEYYARQIINTYGYITLDSFQIGATLTLPNQVLRWSLPTGDGEYYRWDGAFPKSVSAGSTPSTSGGVGSGKWVSVGDAALRGQLAGPGGTGLVFYGADALSKIVSDMSATPDSQGAAGDGSTSDEDAINAAIALGGSAIHLRRGKQYRVTDNFVNTYGVQTIGKGQIVKAVTGGLEMQNSYVDAYQRMTGQENLAAWIMALMQPSAAPKIVFSGDSTTAGDGTSEQFKINLLVAQGLRNRGLQTVYGINTINKGHSGASTAAWNATYVTEDISENGDLYIVRWGINDVKDLSSFATNLREGLNKYRAARPFSSNSILLMMPNSTYDIPNGRDAKWYEQLHDIYVQAARDFKCAFLDTYALTQNSKGLAGLLMDNPYGDGRAIHPNDTLNTIISGYIVDAIAPMGLTTRYGRNRFVTTAGAENTKKTPALLPSTYDGALSFIRVLPVNAWPLDGNAVTFRTDEGTLLQFHFGYKDADRGILYIRYGRAGTLGGEPEGWSSFYQLANRFTSADIVTAGVYSPGTTKCNRTGTQVIIDGKMLLSTPTAINPGVTIGTVPSGYRPTRDAMYGTATMVNANGTSFAQVPVNVQTNGAISVAGSASNVSYIYLNITYDIQ